MDWLRTIAPPDAPAEEFAAGEWIYREGEGGTLVFALLSGEVELSVGGSPVASLDAPTMFGESVFLAEPRRLDSARAVDAVRVLPIGRTRLRQLVDCHPTLPADLARLATTRSISGGGGSADLSTRLEGDLA